MAKKKTEKEKEVDDSRPDAVGETHHATIETDWQKLAKDPDAVMGGLMSMLEKALTPPHDIPKTYMVSFTRKGGADEMHINFSASSIEEAAAIIQKAMKLLPEAERGVAE